MKKLRTWGLNRSGTLWSGPARTGILCWQYSEAAMIYPVAKTQQGKTANEDAFLIEYDSIPVAVVWDGPGNAQVGNV